MTRLIKIPESEKRFNARATVSIPDGIWRVGVEIVVHITGAAVAGCWAWAERHGGPFPPCGPRPAPPACCSKVFKAQTCFPRRKAFNNTSPQRSFSPLGGYQILFLSYPSLKPPQFTSGGHDLVKLARVGQCRESEQSIGESEHEVLLLSVGDKARKNTGGS